MNFGFTEEQDLLRSEARKLLDDQCPMKEVRRLSESPEAYSLAEPGGSVGSPESRSRSITRGS